MKRETAAKAIIVVLICAAIGGVAWYYLTKVHHTRIQNILKNPGLYEGKAATIEGEVEDRTSFFGVVKFFKVKDESGEIIVVAKGTLPEVGSRVRLKGSIDETYPIGDHNFLVFRENALEKEAGAGREGDKPK